MAFCGSCGAQVQDGIKFCQSCGQAVAAGAAPAQPVQPPQYTQPAQQRAQAASPVHQAATQTPLQAGGIYQPPVVPGAPQQADIRDAQENKTMAWLSYLLFFIPLLTGAHKTSPFVKFHANQGTVLFLASLALSIVFGILSAILTAVLTASIATWGAALTIASIFSFVWLALGIVIVIFMVVGILNAVNGRMKPLPVIGRFTIIK